MFSLQLCDLSGSSRGTKIEGAGGFSWFLGPKWAFPAHSGIWARANRRGEKEQTQQPRRGRLQAHHTFHALPGAREGKIIQEDRLQKQREESSVWQGPKLAGCKAKSSSDRAAPILGRSGDRRGSPARDRPALLRRERTSGPLPPSASSTRDLPLIPPHLSGARWPRRRLWPPVPALAHPPCTFPPGASLGTTTGVSVGSEPKPAPLPQARPGHSLSESASAPSVREGGGDTGQREAAAGLGGVRQCGLGSPAAWLAQPSGSPARCCLARSGRGCLLRVRPSASGASVRAGTPARLFCFRFCFWEGTCGLPAPPPPAEHMGNVVPASYSAAARVGDLHPRSGPRGARSGLVSASGFWSSNWNWSSQSVKW